MTEADLKILIAQGESMTLEFKRDSPIKDTELLEAVVCLANADGGMLLIGVEDDGTVTGVHKTHRDFLPSQLEASINNRTKPSVQVRAEAVTIGGFLVHVIRVPQAFGIVSTSDGKILKRSLDVRGKPECLPMYPHEYPSRLAHLRRHDHTALPLEGAGWDDLDPLEFERLNQLLERNTRSDRDLIGIPHEEQAAILGLVLRRDGRLVPTLTGMLLVDRTQALQTFLPTHQAAFQVLGPGQQVEVNGFFREPLLKLLERLEQFIEVRNPEQEFDLGLQRIGVSRYPLEAVREALANAFTHRDYAIHNAVYVRIASDGSLSISSPGGFVDGVNLKNLIVTEPKPRNPSLADAFKRLGLVERTARGVERIFESVLRTGRPAPDYSGTDASTVKVTLPGGEANLRLVQLMLEAQNRQGKPLEWSYLLVLHQAATDGDVTTSEAAELLQADEPRARVVLNHLLELGFLESKGVKRNRSYHLSANVYGRLGRPAAYARQRGLDQAEREQKLLFYLRAKPTITRADVLELFSDLNPNQATYFLKQLVQKGILESSGEKKQRIYRLR